MIGAPEPSRAPRATGAEQLAADLHLELSQLVEELQAAPRGSTLADVRATMLRATAPAVAEAARLCAPLRWLDGTLYERVCADVAGRPPFEEFAAAAPLQRLGAGRWALEDGLRARLLAGWREDEAGWRALNGRLAQIFLAEDGKEARLDALYHLAASPEPADAITVFRRWYREADRAFDMAQCNALLEMLRLQAEWRGPALSRRWRQYRQYYKARMLFADDYHKTGSYLHRDEPLHAFTTLMGGANRSPGAPWIFHVHATGGTGKTMFLRWLLSRYLVPRRIGCARVDFDDLRFRDVVDHPVQLFARIVEQWAQQVEGTALESLLERLHREQQTPGWNPGLLDELRRQLVGAGVSGPIVVVLDTLEDATLAASEWLAQCVSALRGVHASLPGLTLVLSGRYDIAERTTALRPGEWVGFELPRFTPREAETYLRRRGVTDASVRAAILVRCGEDAETTRGTHAPQRDRNPFKLAVFAELALARRTLTAEDVARMPRADVAYLIERVILRIASQPLRWVIRYGAVARHLTVSFLEEVLLPVLRRALRGEVADDTDELLESYQGVWQAEASTADGLTSVELWTELQSYARERGWITASGAGADAELRFHPDVVVPMRHLLRGKPVVREIHARAAESYRRRRETAAPDTPPEALARLACDELFHQFHLDGPGSVDQWREAVRRAEAWGFAAALTIATEILRKDYAEGERVPIEGVTTPAVLFEAHRTAATLIVRQAGPAFSHQHQRWNEFRRHVDTAVAIAADSPGEQLALPHALAAMRDALAREDAGERVAVLGQALTMSSEPRDCVLLGRCLARQLALQRSPEAAVVYRESIRRLAEVPGTVHEPLVHLALADVYEFQGLHRAVIEAQRAALDVTTAGTPLARQVLTRQANYALEMGDIGGAERALARLVDRRSAERLEATSAGEPPDGTPAVRLLMARLALANGEPQAALDQCAAGLQASPPNADRARLLDQAGEASALLFDFAGARGRWADASAAYDAEGGDLALAGAARCALLDARMTALVMEQFDTAASMIESARQLRGMKDVRLSTELHLLDVYVMVRQGRVGPARDLYGKLNASQRANTPAPLRGRVLLFGLLFGLLEAEEVVELREAAGAILPLTRRDHLLGWTTHAQDGVPLAEDAVLDLLALFARPAPASPRFVPAYCERADLCRALGQPELARAQLARVDTAWISPGGPRGALQSWMLQRARQRLGLSTTFVAVHEQALGSGLAALPVLEAIRVTAAEEARAIHDEALVAALAGEGFPRLESQPSSSWLARARALSLPPPRMPGDAPRPLAPGVVPPPSSPDEPLVVSAAAAGERMLEAARTPELAIDLMMADWRGFAREMSDVLVSAGLPADAPEPVPVWPQGELAALPWELATVIGPSAAVVRTSSRARARQWPPWSVQVGRVHVLRPRLGGDLIGDISLESVSGGTLESIYERHDVPPHVSHSPRASELAWAFSAEPPSLVHVVASVRESSAGVSLDFEEAHTRAVYYAKQSSESAVLEPGALDLVYTPGRFSDLLAKAPWPPWVVLDVAGPPNLAEALRMLLLRNTFAAQLFDLGHVRGVLACGLAPQWQRHELTSLLVRQLVEAGPGAALRELRRQAAAEASTSLERVLARGAVALWAAEPRHAAGAGGPA